ncbi:MAG: rubredoxin [Acutalibacteraceae bacterium]|nr:rubredoxin [Acutalibacteraceae bacterium]
MKYVCQICGYVYDDAKEKVPFEQLPSDWKCPLCGAAKTDFKPENTDAKDIKPIAAPIEEELVNLSAGQLAALCSNLARGCEKQYKTQEAELFYELADYFTATVPAVSDATVEKLAADLQQDAENYAGVRATADASGDRGAARICVWGEKVTRMLSSLVNRYLNEGEKMLEGTNIWVCSVCGFVYIGEKAPELCPVCKVPAWKFEKTEGRV